MATSAFLSRLRAAMVARGVLSIAELSKRTGISESRIQTWIETDGFALRGHEFITLRRTLKVRLHWLLAEQGTMHASDYDNETEQILAALTERQIRRWLDQGHRYRKSTEGAG